MSSSSRKTKVLERLQKRVEQKSEPQTPAGPSSSEIGNAGRGLFAPNHPLKQKAEEVFSKEELEEYKKQGEYMYSVDYDKINIDGSGTDETTRFILIALRSGLKISSLEEDEITFMETTYGKNWPEKFGIAR